MASYPHRSRRFCFAALTTLLGAAALLGVTTLVANAQGGGGGQAPPPRSIRTFTARGPSWAWLVAQGDETELFLGAPGAGAPSGPGRAKGTNWTDVALGDQEVWLLQRDGESGRLLRLPRDGAAPPEEVASGLQAPGGLLVRADGVYWLEVAASGDPGLAFIPQLGARLHLKCRSAAGQVRTVADWNVGSAVQARSGDLIEGAGGELYASVRASVATEFYLVTPSGETPQRVAGELASQNAVFSGGQLYWTAPSREATPGSGARCLHRRRPDGSSELAAEWLPRNGLLASLDGRLYYAAMDGLYRIPDRFDAPVFRRKLPAGPVASDGKHLVSIAAAAPTVCGSGSD
ncbi:MAG: hypothetical protein K0Q72_350 [Armatimonadetes bacterium]|nr:hypothetical protein [Armatimonadota bacterium]